MATKQQCYDRLAELALVEAADNQEATTLRKVWTEQIGIFQQLIEMGCNQLPSDAQSVEERLLEKRDLLRNGKRERKAMPDKRSPQTLPMPPPMPPPPPM